MIVALKQFQKRSKNSLKKGTKMVPKLSQCIPKMVPKWSQNGPKIVPKLSESVQDGRQGKKTAKSNLLRLVLK